ncbi:hepatitis A virus cellular receptor 1 homolog isoform X2 [Cololabis saira]|uniref:hepatitis A virus cellular receptor 1 homolog isoform X2 n=1 Tax=Cololabis saira TaxID=129043 RepID=UPI002AD4A753|nr:hepatitis A virus cellular receptor 1 homolog isoform X2 [Cololabis saira]
MSGLSYFLLLILIQMSSGTRKVTGLIGHNVTLSCFYEIKALGVLSFCWGRDEVPNSKCSKTILSSADGAVFSRQSPRYQLLGPEAEGDVSLTILDAQRSDAGVYGCRVEIPGWFNDQKVNIRLIMEEAPVEQPATTTSTQFPTAKNEILESTPKSTKIEKFQSEPNQVYQEYFHEVGAAKASKVSFTVDAFLRMWNICRMAVVFLLTITVIVAFLITRSVLSRRTLHVNTHTVENIYESVSFAK